MTLPVRLYVEPILHKICEPINNFNSPELLILAEDMIETMFTNHGIGLAANQVGIDKNLCVMHLENRTKIIVLANPRVICYTKEKDIMLEGCLSVPGMNIKVERYLGVEVEGQNLLGEKVQYKFKDFDARIFQHEFSHLNGKLISDNIGKLI